MTGSTMFVSLFDLWERMQKADGNLQPGLRLWEFPFYFCSAFPDLRAMTYSVPSSMGPSQVG